MRIIERQAAVYFKCFCIICSIECTCLTNCSKALINCCFSLRLLNFNCIFFTSSKVFDHFFHHIEKNSCTNDRTRKNNTKWCKAFTLILFIKVKWMLFVLKISFNVYNQSMCYCSFCYIIIVGLPWKYIILNEAIFNEVSTRYTTFKWTINC